MRIHPSLLVAVSGVFFLLAAPLHAEPPVASYIFPAGGQRGQTVAVRVGGLFLHKDCGWEMLGSGVEADKALKPLDRLWFEGPLLPLPDSQQAEDYPRDLGSRVRIAADAVIGPRPWRLWTAQGATPALKFMVGELPEIVETETDGDAGPVEVKLPVTINGRIFPRENVDVWAFDAHKGQAVACEVWAARLGSPLDSRIEVRDPQGRTVAENDDAFGTDSFLRFRPAADGRYQVRIHDTQFRGGPAYVYRLTLTTDPVVDRAYPLGGRRGTTAKFALFGQGLPTEAVEVAIPADAPTDFAHRLTLGDKRTNPFVLDVDDLPEYLEKEPAPRIEAPAVVNGRIDRAGGVDCWTVAGKKGLPLEFDLRAQRLGSPLCGVVVVLDAAGKELARAEGGEGGKDDPLLRFTPPTDGLYTVRVQDRFRSRGGAEYAYRLRITAATTLDFRLQLTTDALTLPRGGTAKFRILAERRGGFADAIPLEIEGLPAGVTATGAIPAGQNQVEINFKADASAAIGPSRLTIRGTAKVAGASITHTASLSLGRGSGELDAVLLATALPTPFKVVADYEMRWAARGTVHLRRYRIERNGYDGPIEVSLADRQARHLQGATGPTLLVPAGATAFEYPIQLPPWMEMGRTCRVCVMAVGAVKEADGREHIVSYSSTQQNEQFIAVVQPELLGVASEKGSVAVTPGREVELAVRATRGKDVVGPIKLELVVPRRTVGIGVEALMLTADQNRGVLRLRFADEVRGLGNGACVLRATAADKNGRPVIAECPVELVQRP